MNIQLSNNSKMRNKKAISISSKLIDESINKINFKGKILDIGARHSPYSNKGNVISLDKFPYKEVDVIADAEKHIPFKKNSFDMVLLIFVLEYIKNPQKVIDNIYGVLKPNGKLILTAPFMYPFHPLKKDDDFWRYTPASIKFLLSKFSKIEIIPKGYFLTLIAIYIEFILEHLKLHPIIFLLNPLIWLDKKIKLFKNTAVHYFIIAIK